MLWCSYYYLTNYYFKNMNHKIKQFKIIFYLSKIRLNFILKFIKIFNLYNLLFYLKEFINSHLNIIFNYYASSISTSSKPFFKSNPRALANVI